MVFLRDGDRDISIEKDRYYRITISKGEDFDCLSFEMVDEVLTHFMNDKFVTETFCEMFYGEVAEAITKHGVDSRATFAYKAMSNLTLKLLVDLENQLRWNKNER